MPGAPGRTHLRAGGLGASRDPTPLAHCAGWPRRRQARLGKGHGRRRHLPDSTSSSAGSNSRAGSPWHHLPPPPRRRRRLPTAHQAPPTDTTAGVPVPAAAPNSGREGAVGAERGRGQAPRLWVKGRGTGGRGLSEPRGRAAEGPRGSAEGSAGPRTRPQLGLLLSTLSLPPQGMPGNDGRGRGVPGGPAAQRGVAQVRKSAGCREGGGSASGGCRLVSDLAVLS
ncbi:translation initiation factor IF-2-like [Equus quagga]|uniref:translation initiation factor IF-2-like n=1 Tax=Equus quagga TaxID=89248 RepID=UPI001EE2374C|nr:translation initiation factor IF-2-like [Equus quagga]